MAKKREIILATQNKHKVREIKHILSGLPVKISSLLDFPQIPPIKEDGKTFVANATKKARVVVKRLGKMALADDSGLQVDYLKGLPGIKSARFAGPKATKKDLCNKILRLLRNVPPAKRKARFICTVVILLPSGKKFVIEGIVKGRIIDKMQGGHGFGYDPIFVPQGYKKTFAQMKPNFKNQLSHRARAFAKAKKILPKLL